MKLIIIDFSQSSVRTALVDNGELIEVIIDDPSEPHFAGNIYAGLVSRVLPNGFAFIDIGKKEHAFMDLNAYKDFNVKQGDRLLVQISRSGYGDKAAIATAELNFTGRYAVVIHSPHSGIGVSKKIKNASDRKRLKKLTKELLPKGYGAIVRTEAAGVPENEFADEITALTHLAKKITDRGINAKAPSTVYERSHLLHSTLQSLIDGTVSEIVLNKPDELKPLTNVLNTLGFDEKLLTLSNTSDLFAHYSLTAAYNRALNKQVQLKSGGYIVIEKTEACVVIDVNSGKSVRQASRFVTNCEAAVEIAYQLRLRNLSGIIIIDFIGMSKTEEKRQLHRLLEQKVSRDRVRVNVVGMTKLGLMQLTRQRTGKALEIARGLTK